MNLAQNIDRYNHSDILATLINQFFPSATAHPEAQVDHAVHQYDLPGLRLPEI